VVKARRYGFFKKQSLEQIDPFDILHNMIEQIDSFIQRLRTNTNITQY
jgi:hypothetical protein